MTRPKKLRNIALTCLSMSLTVLMCCLTTPADTTISAIQARQPVLGVAGRRDRRQKAHPKALGDGHLHFRAGVSDLRHHGHPLLPGAGQRRSHPRAADPAERLCPTRQCASAAGQGYARFMHSCITAMTCSMLSRQSSRSQRSMIAMSPLR